MRSADPYGFQKPFEIRVETRGKTALLRLGGEFDLAGKKEFEACLSRVKSGRYQEVVLDLSEVSFIDSTGVGLVLEAWSQSRRGGFDFVVLLPDVDGRVRGVFQEMGLDQALPIVAGLPALGDGPAPDGEDSMPNERSQAFN
jgi:anti-sigma B factor antagonist